MAFNFGNKIEGTAYAILNEIFGVFRGKGGFSRPSRYEVILVPPAGTNSNLVSSQMQEFRGDDIATGDVLRRARREPRGGENHHHDVILVRFDPGDHHHDVVLVRFDPSKPYTLTFRAPFALRRYISRARRFGARRFAAARRDGFARASNRVRGRTTVASSRESSRDGIVGVASRE